MHLDLNCARFVLNIVKDSLTSLTLMKCQRFRCRLSKITNIRFNISYFFQFKHALCKIRIVLSKIWAWSTADHQNTFNCARFTSKTLKICTWSTADQRNCTRFADNCARLTTFTMDTNLSYEETVPLLQRSYFGDFRFLKRDEVVKVIQDLSDEPYGLLPEIVDKEPLTRKQGKKMTTKEVGKLSKAAQILIMSDERKAAAISHYVREVIHKELQAVPSSNQHTSGYNAILQQISNTEYI